MRLINNICEIKDIVRSQKKAGKTIGLVPTMGYLHEGHLSLAKASISDNGFTIMSIFVNPTQFGPGEDFSRYPRDMERDTRMAEEAGVDAVFAPSAEEMYPGGYKTYVNVEDITEALCGKSRPGHFKGVTTVVNKLLNITEADKAYFGQKDAQQAIVIQKMVNDLNMNVHIVTCPIVREADGLAMSSRNVYLSPEERNDALILSRSLYEAENRIREGERSAPEILQHITQRILAVDSAQIDYIEIVGAENLDKKEYIDGKVLIALAVKFGKTRLIDNIIVEV